MTAEQISANRAAAVVAVRDALGLSKIEPSRWTYEERIAYNKALAAYIAARPEQFSAQDLTTAEYVGKANYVPLEDASFDYGMFAVETVKPAADALKSVGDGVLTVANSAKWAIPLGFAVVGVLLLVNFNRKIALS
jgi:hypothetical protein